MAWAPRIPVRYLTIYNRGPEDNVEANIWPIEKTFEIDPGTVALVLVDTREKHPVKSHP